MYFEKDQAEDDVLVFRRVHVAAQLVSREPELLLKADIGGVIVRRFVRSRHRSAENNRKCAGTAIKKEKGRIKKQDSGKRISDSRRVCYP